MKRVASELRPSTHGSPASPPYNSRSSCYAIPQVLARPLEHRRRNQVAVPAGHVRGLVRGFELLGNVSFSSFFFFFFSQLFSRPSRAVWYALRSIRARAYRMPVGACNQMVLLIFYVFRYSGNVTGSASKHVQQCEWSPEKCNKLCPDWT